MENYKVLMKIAKKEVFAEEISDRERQDTVSVLLRGSSSREDVVVYKKRMRVNPDTDMMYPDYYIPPYNENKKLRLIQGYLPKTHILYANHYELEIMRLLFLFAPENETIREMVKHTLYRLKNTCFGNFCAQGECVAAGISVLRFLAVVKPEDTEWTGKLIKPLGDRFLSLGNGPTAGNNRIPLTYLLMAFTDINNEETRELILQRKEWLLGLLRKGWLTGKLSNGKIAEADRYNVMGKYIIRNAIGTLPEYKEIANNEIYINDIDGRCYCNI